MGIRLRFADVESGFRIGRSAASHTAGLASGVLHAFDRRARHAASAGAHAGAEEGGQTTGLAFRLPESTLREELELLWKREMITDCYVPTWCELQLEGGEAVTALVFVMNPQHPLFEADTSHQVIAPLIASASGPLGTNAQYLFALDNELKHHGMQDDCIGDLVRYVQQWLQQNRPGAFGAEATA